MAEEYREINGFEDYEITNKGRVLNCNTGKFMKLQTCIWGYLYVQLTNPRKDVTKKVKIHRIVADAFVEKPEGMNVVDHIDRNRKNNDPSNLRWTNHVGNARNQTMLKRNTSGMKGIFYRERDQSWVASINNNDNKTICKYFHIGKYGDAEAKRLAVQWRQAKEEEYGYICE